MLQSVAIIKLGPIGSINSRSHLILQRLLSMLGAEVRVFAGHFQRSVPNPLRYQITVHTGLLKPGYGAMPHGVSCAIGQSQLFKNRF